MGTKDGEFKQERNEQHELLPLVDGEFPGGANDFPNNQIDVNEEMGAEFATGVPVVNTASREDRLEQADDRGVIESSGTALGWVSILFAVASWFIWPVLLGATAAVLGFMAYKQGARGLGGWSMAIGVLALALNLIIVPFFYALT